MANLLRRLIFVIVSQLSKREFLTIVGGENSRETVKCAERVLNHTTSAALALLQVIAWISTCVNLAWLALVQVLGLGHATCHVIEMSCTPIRAACKVSSIRTDWIDHGALLAATQLFYQLALRYRVGVQCCSLVDRDVKQCSILREWDASDRLLAIWGIHECVLDASGRLRLPHKDDLLASGDNLDLSRSFCTLVAESELGAIFTDVDSDLTLLVGPTFNLSNRVLLNDFVASKAFCKVEEFDWLCKHNHHPVSHHV